MIWIQTAVRLLKSVNLSPDQLHSTPPPLRGFTLIQRLPSPSQPPSQSHPFLHPTTHTLTSETFVFCHTSDTICLISFFGSISQTKYFERKPSDFQVVNVLINFSNRVFFFHKKYFNFLVGLEPATLGFFVFLESCTLYHNTNVVFTLKQKI